MPSPVQPSTNADRAAGDPTGNSIVDVSQFLMGEPEAVNVNPRADITQMQVNPSRKSEVLNGAEMSSREMGFN
jgi:hypothetical protein